MNIVHAFCTQMTYFVGDVHHLGAMRDAGVVRAPRGVAHVLPFASIRCIIIIIVIRQDGHVK